MSQKDEFQIDITPSTFHSVRNTHFYKSSISEIDAHLETRNVNSIVPKNTSSNFSLK